MHYQMDEHQRHYISEIEKHIKTQTLHECVQVSEVV